jgi:hypothetical protein
MSFRNWLLHPPIGVGLGILALLAVAFLAGDRHKTDCRDASPEQYQTCTFKNVTEASVSPVGTIKAPQRNPKPDRNEWREESDLYAQWSMVWWAKASAIIAGIGLFITSVGIVLVKQTLDANRAAVAAANRANESQREIGEAQVRAYLTISKVVGKFTDDGLQVQFTASNSGNSPADNIELPFEIWPGWGEPPRVNDISRWNMLSVGPLRSGGEIIETFRTGFYFDPETPHGKINMLIRIRMVVTYTDVFGRRHDEPIAFMGSFPIPPGDKIQKFEVLTHERFPWLDQPLKV